jgi:hypothetical protein
VIFFLRSFFREAISFPQGLPLLIFCGFCDICNLRKIPSGFHQTFVLSTKQGEGGDMTVKNKRACTRFRTSKRAEIRAKGAVYLGTIEDNCDSGVFIETGGHFSVGQDISITLESPKFESEKRTGRIIRVTPRGIGVKFNYPGYTR